MYRYLRYVSMAHICTVCAHAVWGDASPVVTWSRVATAASCYAAVHTRSASNGTTRRENQTEGERDRVRQRVRERPREERESERERERERERDLLSFAPLYTPQFGYASHAYRSPVTSIVWVVMGPPDRVVTAKPV